MHFSKLEKIDKWALGLCAFVILYLVFQIIRAIVR